MWVLLAGIPVWLLGIYNVCKSYETERVIGMGGEGIAILSIPRLIAWCLFLDYCKEDQT